MVKTTEKDFKTFKQECQKWIDYFGLKCWHINFKHYLFENNEQAACISDLNNRCATIEFNKEMVDFLYSEYSIRKFAFHEVCELLLSDLRALALMWCSKSMVAEANHEIIRILENSVFKDLEGKI